MVGISGLSSVLHVVKLSALSLPTNSPGLAGVTTDSGHLCSEGSSVPRDNMYLGGYAEDLALVGLELKMGLFCLDSCSRKMDCIGNQENWNLDQP